MKRLLIALSTRRCDGKCGDASVHTAHLTALGRKRYSAPTPPPVPPRPRGSERKGGWD